MVLKNHAQPRGLLLFLAPYLSCHSYIFGGASECLKAAAAARMTLLLKQEAVLWRIAVQLMCPMLFGQTDKCKGHTGGEKKMECMIDG